MISTQNLVNIINFWNQNFNQSIWLGWLRILIDIFGVFVSFIFTVLLYDHIVIIIISCIFKLISFLIFFLLSFVMVLNNGIQDLQACTFAVFSTLVDFFKSKFSDFLNIFFFTNYIVKFFDFKHIEYYRASIQVWFFVSLWSKLINKLWNSKLLFFFDLSHNFWFKVLINLSKELIQDFRYWLLIDVFQKLLNDVLSRCENIWY